MDDKEILKKIELGLGELSFPFATVARNFQIINSYLKSVIIPWDEAAKASIKKLNHLDRAGATARKLQPYIVQIDQRARDTLVYCGAAKIINEVSFGDSFVALDKEKLYDDRIGLSWQDPTYEDPSDLIV